MRKLLILVTTVHSQFLEIAMHSILVALYFRCLVYYLSVPGSICTVVFVRYGRVMFVQIT